MGLRARVAAGPRHSAQSAARAQSVDVDGGCSGSPAGGAVTTLGGSLAECGQALPYYKADSQSALGTTGT